MKPARNFWPLGIILTFVIFISGTIGLVVMAFSQKVDLVSEDYYEQEIKFQNRLDRLGHTQHLGATVAYEAAAKQILIRLPDSQAGQAVTGRIQLYRPSAAGLDRELALNPDQTGAQSLDAGSLRPGLWKVRITWNVGKQEYFLDQQIVVPARAS
jgi:hypothetical protein